MSVAWPNKHADDLQRPPNCLSSFRFAFDKHNVLARFEPLSLAFVRRVSGPTPHSFSEHASAHVVSATSVSKYSNELACPIIQAMVFDSSGICIWQSNCSSFLSILTLPPTNLTANPCRAWSPSTEVSKLVTHPAVLVSQIAAATCITAGTPLLCMVICVDPSAYTHCQLLDLCGSDAPFLSTQRARTFPDRRSFATHTGGISA